MIEEKLWEIVSNGPGIALSALILFWMLKALNRSNDTNAALAKEHTAAYVANQKVLEKNSKVIGECSAVMRDCREEIREAHRRASA